MDSVAAINGGDTAWMLISTALVLLMTPGLAFFYAGMVRAKNVVSILLQCVSAVAISGLLWTAVGYSLSFSGNNGGFIGNLDAVFLNGVGLTPDATFGPTIPHILFMAFQMMFAIITPALISGALAERISFQAWVLFVAVWGLVVYCPVAHWVWGSGGWIASLGGLDFAGGLVVHMTSGFSALVACLLLGRRKDVSPMKSHSLFMVAVGTALLIFGWFGFNAGSALSASGIAAHALVTTFLGCAGGLLAWMLMDWMSSKPTMVGACIGSVAGLVAITPAAGYVSVTAAIAIGLAAGVVCNRAVKLFKEKFHVVDDTLDVFACHGVGGLLGTILTGVFASTAVNPAGADGLLYGSSKVFIGNLLGALAVVAYSLVCTYIILKVIALFVSLRVSDEHEANGLDSLHGEEILNLDPIFVRSQLITEMWHESPGSLRSPGDRAPSLSPN